jgi:activator of HSP90 ATPase
MTSLKFETITQTAVIDGAPNEVYEAYVDPRKHSEFTGSPATGSPKVGERFTAWDGYIEGRFLELEKGKKIVHEWKTTEWPAGYPASVVELKLKPKGKQTELTMVHSKVPAEQAEEYAEGWRDYYWEPMKEHFRKNKRD